MIQRMKMKNLSTTWVRSFRPLLEKIFSNSSRSIPPSDSISLTSFSLTMLDNSAAIFSKSFFIIFIIIIPTAFLIFDLNKIFLTLNDTDKQYEKNKAESCLVHFPALWRLNLIKVIIKNISYINRTGEKESWSLRVREQPSDCGKTTRTASHWEGIK